MRPITLWLLFVHWMLGGFGGVIDGAPARPAPCWRARRRIAEPTRRFLGETARPQWKVPPWTGRGMPLSVHASRSPGRGAALPPFAARGETGWWSLSGTRVARRETLASPQATPCLQASAPIKARSVSLRSKLAQLDRFYTIVGGPPVRPSTEPGAEGSPTHELGVLQQAIANEA